MANPISHSGFKVLRFVEELGRMATFTAAIGLALVTPPVRFGAFVREIYKLGVLSLIIICVSGAAVGMVLGLQGYHMLSHFGAQTSLGEMVALSLIREMGPLMTALLVIGRAGSATTAEIGAMVATEQLDGLRMLSVDPIHFIVTPRALGMLFVVPLLTAMFILCGIFGGYIVGVGFMGGDPGTYMSGIVTSVNFHSDVAGSILKSVIFGILLGLISTYRGYTSRPTSEGVSSATTSTVVIGSVSVLLFDYVITALWGV
jgi:phospholipid/cholesterol/gamma-HCH transport system permease protein